MSRPAADVLAAWQAALAAEQQAAFGYALLGPRLSAAEQPAARADQAAHESLRDATAGAIAASGADPVSSSGDYPALYPLSDTPRALAVRLEDECAAAWRYLVARAPATAAGAGLRASAVQALVDSAVRAVPWRLRAGARHPVVPFPGIG